METLGGGGRRLQWRLHDGRMQGCGVTVFQGTESLPNPGFPCAEQEGQGSASRCSLAQHVNLLGSRPGHLIWVGLGLAVVGLENLETRLGEEIGACTHQRGGHQCTPQQLTSVQAHPSS